jgi:hypothetical protein
MEFFRNIRLKIGDSMLRNKAVKTHRKIQYSNLRQVKSIGIVWDASKTDEFGTLLKFCQKMAESDTEVKIIGYYSGKNLPDQYTAQRYLTLIKREELNFFYLPVSADTNAFIKNSFDVLIDLNFKKHLPLRYISTLSHAHLKIGLFESEKNSAIFDLMMDLKSPVGIEDYLKHIVHYLEMINSESVIIS